MLHKVVKVNFMQLCFIKPGTGLVDVIILQSTMSAVGMHPRVRFKGKDEVSHIQYTIQAIKVAMLVCFILKVWINKNL